MSTFQPDDGFSLNAKHAESLFKEEETFAKTEKSFVRVFPSRILHCFFKLKKLGKRRFLEKTKVCYFVDERENVRIRF